jgi:hypothetical protein
MVSIGRPSILPPTNDPAPSCVNSKPCASPRGLGTMNSDSPRWVFDRSGSVRARSISTSARAPNVHHVFTPLMT